jgi:hypothetical protein
LSFSVIPTLRLPQGREPYSYDSPEHSFSENQALKFAQMRKSLSPKSFSTPPFYMLLAAFLIDRYQNQNVIAPAMSLSTKLYHYPKNGRKIALDSSPEGSCRGHKLST